MLNNIRKTADSLIIKILLGMIIFVFVGWGIKDVLQPTNVPDLVKFSYAPNINKNDFLKAKAEHLRIIQNQTGTIFSEEDLKQLNIENFIIKKLINNSVWNYLVSYYDLDLTDDNIVHIIKEAPDFKNNQHLFDLKLFKSFLKNSYLNEEKYLTAIKEQTLKNLLFNIFSNIFPVPRFMIQNLVNYMAETREIDLLEINLNHQPQGETIPSPTKTQLETFYRTNQNLFELPEKRNLSYIKTSNEIWQKQMHNSYDELLNFYHTHKEKFDNKNFSEVEKQIELLLLEQKREELYNQLIKSLDEEIATGTSLIELSQKYGLSIQDVNYISYNELLNNPDLSQYTENIFKLAEGEVSYPMIEKDSLILVEVKDIQSKNIPEFSLIKEQVQKLWNQQYLQDLNLKHIQAISTEYNKDNNIHLLGISIKPTHFIRSEIYNNKILPIDLLLAIFHTPANFNTPVFRSQDIAYFAHINLIRTDKITSKNIEEKNRDEIIKMVKNTVIDELINYLIKQNKMEIYPENLNTQ